MKKIVVTIAILLILILVIVTASRSGLFGRSEGVMPTSTSTSTSDSTAEEGGAHASTSSVKEGTPLPKGALTEEQRSLAESLGIDVDSFVITETMIRCVEEKLGTERLDEIMAGASPSPLEAMRMLPCI